jgi:hypothetical protein
MSQSESQPSPHGDGWAGVFRPLRHIVAINADGLNMHGVWVLFALCKSPCWESGAVTPDMPWCGQCLLLLQKVNEAKVSEE